MKFCVCAAGVLLSAGAALGQWADDFNRPDGPIGGDWTVASGSFAVESNQGKSTGAGIQSMTHTTASAPYGSVVMNVDVFCVGTTLQYVALQSGLGGSDNLYIKVQSQDASGNFHVFGMYHGNNGGGWGGVGSGFFLLSAPFASARMTVSIDGTGDVLTLEFDTDFNGTADQTYTASGVNAISSGFGTGFGVGAFGVSFFDNWKVGPASPSCYPDCTGEGVLTVADFGCFQGRYVLGDLYADCTGEGTLTVADFGCFQGKYVLGCP